MYCKKCGTQNPDQAKFCTMCGNVINNSNLNPRSPGSVAANAVSFSLTVISAIILVIYMTADRMSKNDMIGGMCIVGGIALVALAVIVVLKLKKIRVDTLGWIGFTFDCALILFSIFLALV